MTQYTYANKITGTYPCEIKAHSLSEHRGAVEDVRGGGVDALAAIRPRQTVHLQDVPHLVASRQE